MRFVVLSILAADLSVAPLVAQHCTKGIPCGNTCIAATKTCRVGQGTATQAGPPAALPAATPLRSTPAADAEFEAFLSQYAVPAGASRDSTAWPWGAYWPFGWHYYPTTEACLVNDYVRRYRTRVFFKTEEDAKRARHLPGSLPRC